MSGACLAVSGACLLRVCWCLVLIWCFGRVSGDGWWCLVRLVRVWSVADCSLLWSGACSCKCGMLLAAGFFQARLLAQATLHVHVPPKFWGRGGAAEVYSILLRALRTPRKNFFACAGVGREAEPAAVSAACCWRPFVFPSTLSGPGPP